MVTNVMSLHIERIGSELWKNVLVQMLDYIANPQIEKKNMLVVDELLGKYIPTLGTKPHWLKEITSRIEYHARTCYDQRAVQRRTMVAQDDDLNAVWH